MRETEFSKAIEEIIDYEFSSDNFFGTVKFISHPEFTYFKKALKKIIVQSVETYEDLKKEKE